MNVQRKNIETFIRLYSTSQMFHVIFINEIVHKDLFTKETIKIWKRTTQIDVPMVG